MPYDTENLQKGKSEDESYRAFILHKATRFRRHFMVNFRWSPLIASVKRDRTIQGRDPSTGQGYITVLAFSRTEFRDKNRRVTTRCRETDFM